MKIGFDFDNTIVCYDEAIHILSNNLNLPKDLMRNKLFIRNYLKSQNRDNEWTEFQGELYGPGMQYAYEYEYLTKIFEYLIGKNHTIFIISHRSRYPYCGKKYDLHSYAKKWIYKNLNSLEKILSGNIYFLETLNEKIKKIDDLKIDIFIDDLPEVICHSKFPISTRKILFDPNNTNGSILNKISNWKELSKYV